MQGENAPSPFLFIKKRRFWVQFVLLLASSAMGLAPALRDGEQSIPRPGGVTQHSAFKTLPVLLPSLGYCRINPNYLRLRSLSSPIPSPSNFFLPSYLFNKNIFSTILYPVHTDPCDLC